MAAPMAGPTSDRAAPRRHGSLLHAFLIVLALLWLFPIAMDVYTSLRPFGDTPAQRLRSLPDDLNFDNFVTAWNQAPMAEYFFNTAIIAISAVAHAVPLVDARLRLLAVQLPANLLLLMVFTAGNLLPPQVIIVPLYRMYLLLPLPRR